MQQSVSYWWPRVAASFGSGDSDRFEALKAMGLRSTPNAELKARWEEETSALLKSHGVAAP